jgi:hypothetical protein
MATTWNAIPLLPLRGRFIRRFAFAIAGTAALFASITVTSCGGTSHSSSSSGTPSITTQPQNQTVTAPAPATFSVIASGTAPLEYQWTKNGSVIAGATSATYTTPATSTADDGAKYVAVVTNSAGTATSAAAVLTVNSSSGSGSISLSATAGDGQSALVMTAFAATLQATVKDASGNPISNESVTFTAPASGASLSFSNGGPSTTATTDTNGIANSGELTANSTAGSYSVTATINGSTASTTFNLTNVLSTGIPQFSHVFIVVEENHGFSDVIGNASMPYLNGLANSNSVATQYYADAHPSLPDYFELTVGEGTAITGTMGDSYNGPVTQDNVVRALVAAGKSWKSYAESLPKIGYLGGDSVPYLRRHNPVVYFSDVQQSSTQANNVVPFSQLATDIANRSLPEYGFIAPNVNDDAHDCPAGKSSCTDDEKLAAADQWLSANIQPLISSPAFQNSLLIIVFDEAEDSDTAHGGGHVPAILVSPLVKSGYQSTTFYQHGSVLRLMMEGLGIADLPGSAATAPDMTEFFP